MGTSHHSKVLDYKCFTVLVWAEFFSRGSTNCPGLAPGFFLSYLLMMEEAPQNLRQPIFNIPGSVLAVLALIAAIHCISEWFLPASTLHFLILNFGFIPFFWPTLAEVDASLWGVWVSPVTYSLLHADWGHLGVNALWMVVFGTVVARRLGAIRFILLCILASIGGALAHYVSHVGQPVPMIGASAVVSGFMGAATRFAFPRGGGFDNRNVNLPRLSLLETFMNRQLLAFIGLWFAINYLFGAGLVSPSLGGSGIAWQAHIGGFLAGLLLFAPLDPVKRSLVH